MEEFRIAKIEEFVEELQSELNPEIIGSKALDSSIATLGFRSGLFLHKTEEQEIFIIKAQRGFRNLRKQSDVQNISIHIPISQIKSSSFREIYSSIKVDKENISNALQEIFYIFILQLENQVFGVLLFGNKIDETALSVNDIRAIQTILKASSMSLRIYDHFMNLSRRILEIESLKDAVLSISSILNLEELSREVYTLIKGFLYPRGGMLLFRIYESNYFQVLKGDPPVYPRNLVGAGIILDFSLIDYFQKNSNSKFIYEFSELPLNVKDSILYSLPEINFDAAYYIIPIVIENKLIDLFIFGKTNLSSFSSSTESMLIAFLTQAHSSFKNAIQYKREETLRVRFQKYVPKQIVEDAIEGKDSIRDGIQKKVVILFSDIRDFTRFCENKNPSEVVITLNEYFELMLDAIDSTNGILDKLIGDAIMATWGIFDDRNDHIENAARSALQMLEHLAIYNSKQPKEKQIQIGIGLHFGEVKAGNIGGKKRSDFTIIGDSVNLAARLEGVTKNYGVSIVTSQDFYDPIKDKFIFRELDVIRVKGKNEPIKIYELLGEAS